MRLIGRLVLTKHCPINLAYKPPFTISPLLREGICLARATWGGAYMLVYTVLAGERFSQAAVKTASMHSIETPFEDITRHTCYLTIATAIWLHPIFGSLYEGFSPQQIIYF